MFVATVAPLPVPLAAAALAKAYATGIVLTPFTRLPAAVIAALLAEMNDRLYGVPTLQTTLTVEFADSEPRIVERLPKLTAVAETEQALTMVTCTLNVPDCVTAKAEDAPTILATATIGRRYLRMTLPCD